MLFETSDSKVLNPLLVNLSFLTTQPTGLTTYANNLVAELRSLHPTFITPQPLAKATYYPICGNLSADQGSKGHFRRILWTQRKLPQIYQRLQTNLLFSPVPEAPLYTRCRYVVTVHDLIPLRFPRRFSPLTFYCCYYVPQVLARAEHILCNSAATARDITNFLGIQATKITPIPLAYDANHFRCFTPSTAKGRGCPYFFYLGRHDSYKNLHRLISAFAALPNCRDCQLWIAGPPDQRYTPKLEAQAAELGLSQQVNFLNYVPYEQLPRIMNEAVAFVFPSLWEGFGLPVLEAMACGTPVITSNLSSLPEVAGDAALLVDPYNPQELTAAMHALATNQKLRSHLRTLSLQRASQFSWTKTGQATVEVLKRFI